MKRLLVILLTCLYTVNVNSQCTNSVDSIITPPYIMCHKDSIHVSTVGQGFVMPGYTKFYAIFSDSICDSSHLVYFNTIPILNNLPSNLSSCGIYYYFVVVSDFNTSNSIDFNNPCLVNSNGIPFMFNKSIVSMLGGTITVPGNTGNLDCENNYVFCSDVSTFGIDACIPNTWSNIGNIQNAIANGGPCDFSPYYVYDTVVLPYCVLKTEWYDTTWLPASNAPAGCYVNGDTIFYNSDTLIFSDIHSTSPNIQVLNQPIINSSLHLQYAAVYHVIYDTLPGPCVFYVALNNCDETLMSTTIIGSIYANIDFNPPNPLQVSYAPISEPCYCGTEITIYNGVAPFVLNGNYTPDAYNPSGIITYVNDTVTDLSFLTNIYSPTYWFDNLEITDLCGSSVTINGGLTGDWTYQFDFNNYYPLIQQNSCGLVDFSFSVNNSTLCGYYDFFVNDDNGAYVPCNNCSVSNGTFSYADLTEGWYYVGYSACYGDNIFVDSFEVIWSPSCDDNDCTTLDTYNTQNCMCEHTPIPPPSCDDNDCTTLDTYNTQNCMCEHTPIPPPSCDDNDCTTLDTYNTQNCMCEHTPIPPPSCDDNDCTTLDTYNTQSCMCEHIPIPPPSCDDNDCTTLDTYNTQSCMCEHTPIPLPNCTDNLVATSEYYDTILCECHYDTIQTEDCKITIPDAFSPNGDNLNDYFSSIIECNFDYLVAFKIYNRWGDMVFDSDKSSLKKWDGTINGIKQTPDNYIVVGQVKLYQNSNVVQTVPFKTNLLLVR